MKILRISYEWPPPWGGLVAAPYEMTYAQTQLGHKIDVFCGRWPRSGPIEKMENVKLHPFLRELLPGTISITTSLVVFFYYLFWRRKNKPDVIHSHGHLAIWIYFYRKFLKKFFPKSKELKVPLIVHFHNTVRGRAENLENGGKQIKLVSKILSWPLAEKSDRWAVQVADACIFVSKDIKQDAIKYYGANPQTCFVVETGVNTRLFKPIDPEERSTTREELGFNSVDKVILNHGVMVERKNIHLLIEAIKFLPENYKLFLFGPIPKKEYRDKLDLIIEKNNLEKRVVRAGYAPYPQVPIGFQASDVFVLPSSWEGLPKVVMQSLACGVPVLASGFKAQNDLPGLVYVDKLNPKVIAKQIKQIISEDTSVDLAKIRLLYSWSIMAKKVNKIYDTILK